MAFCGDDRREPPNSSELKYETATNREVVGPSPARQPSNRWRRKTAPAAAQAVRKLPLNRLNVGAKAGDCERRVRVQLLPVLPDQHRRHNLWLQTVGRTETGGRYEIDCCEFGSVKAHALGGVASVSERPLEQRRTSGGDGDLKGEVG